MKRFVIELANDIISRDAKNELMRPEVRNERKTTIERFVKICNDGLITDYEAVYGISRFQLGW